MPVVEVRIDYVLEGETDPRINVREGSQVMLCAGMAKVAEAVVQGDAICVNGLQGTVDEVGRVEINDDGTTNARTVLSPAP